MSPAAGGGDRGGEAWSKRGGRRGRNKAHRGGKEWREDGAVAAVQSAGADTRPVKERRGGGRWRRGALYRRHGGEWGMARGWRHAAVRGGGGA
jgi:hypothetical protein